ncbi:MAG TPA: 30S ribosomal protein S12 methylthiotransferase RimO, partial [Phycisphaerae bacterium]|nr:30S ribosomal protein S12 methylthiotransferase RimO [Phycisphaerae bacterium]
MKQIAFVCLGCSKNLVDGEKMLAQLAEAGCVVGAPMDQADVIVINTCGFLAAARDESHDYIAEALAVKAKRENVRVVVAGCLPSRDGEDIYHQADGVDAIVGVNDREAIVEAVLGDGIITRLSEYPAAASIPAASDSGRFRLTDQHTAYLRIAEGCSQKCTFCTIPV